MYSKQKLCDDIDGIIKLCYNHCMNKELFVNGLKQLNIEVTDIGLKRFERYSELLKEWNERINLTAITDDDGIAVKHFLDSALPLKYLDTVQGARLVDVGTGAGFPGLPIKILRPDIEVTLIDSLNKRVRFLNEVIAELGLSGITAVHGRAEELSRKPEYRERFDLAISRAVANMTTLSEYCLPYAGVGGMFVALKARDAEEEIRAAMPIMGTLGGRIKDVTAAPLPESDIVRTIAVIEKVRPTPAAFPRSAKKIKNSGGKQ